MIELTYQYECSVCGITHIEKHKVHMYLGEIPKPRLPMGWHVLDKHIICNKHEFPSLYDIARADDQHKKERENANASAQTKPTSQEGQEGKGKSTQEGKETNASRTNKPNSY